MAIAAVTLLAVPALAAASQIVVPAVQEEVVEGHTVFAVIEKVVRANETETAAAVAVLVREMEIKNNKFKGVLWFNDQYLVAPFNSTRVNARYPCGGSVIAVNAGDPDPRTMLTSYNGTDTYQTITGRSSDANDTQSYDSDYIQYDVYNQSGPTPPTQHAPGTLAGPPSTSSGSTTTTSPNYNNSYADYGDPDGIANTPATGGKLGSISTSLGTQGLPFFFEYNESYLITDPNDHTWVIDKYDALTVNNVNLDHADISSSTSSFPIWVVNILGKPVFTPDDGYTSCGPFVDDPWQQGMINTMYSRGDKFTCGVTTALDKNACPSNPPGFGLGDANGDELYIDGLDVLPPALGYYEPTDEDQNGAAATSYCYDGNERDQAGGRNTGRRSGAGCDHGNTWMPAGAGAAPANIHFPGHIDPAGKSHRIDSTNNPLRLYNALLYFFFGAGDITVTDDRAHAATTDTNGCQVGTEWACPGGNDDAEGNSHPFNPPGVYVPRHAGVDNTQQGGYWVDVPELLVGRDCSEDYDPVATDPNGEGVCNINEHASHERGQVDLYFSPVARPMEPPVRVFAEYDIFGRLDPFHENNCRDDGTGNCADYHPGQPDVGVI